MMQNARRSNIVVIISGGRDQWPQPSGLVQRLTDLPLDRYLTVREGQD